MLLVLLLGIADFGRVFTAGITIEAAARDAAEVGAQEYLRNLPPEPTDSDYATFDFSSFYGHLHEKIAQTACAETTSLADDRPSAIPGASCHDVVVVAICVHDDDPAITDPADPACGTVANSNVAAWTITQHSQDCPYIQGDHLPPYPPDAEPPVLDPAWTPEQTGSAEQSRYIEVRICYRFRTLFPSLERNLQLPFGWGLTIGDTFLSRRATFTVADY
jgi:hypothetical protein